MDKKEKFKNGKVYKIIDKTNGNVYIGSTCQTLSQRLTQHKANYKQYLKGNTGNNTTSFEILKNNNYEIVLLENCNNITSKDELHNRERYYIDSLECVNKCRPGVFNELGKEQYKKHWVENNKDKLDSYKGKYKGKYKETLHKIYLRKKENETEENKQKRKEYHQEHYKNNKTKYLESSKRQNEKLKEALKLLKLVEQGIITLEQISK